MFQSFRISKIQPPSVEVDLPMIAMLSCNFKVLSIMMCFNFQRSQEINCEVENYF